MKKEYANLFTEIIINTKSNYVQESVCINDMAITHDYSHIMKSMIKSVTAIKASNNKYMMYSDNS